jgi:DNA-binding Xre family transcriptional regulator
LTETLLYFVEKIRGYFVVMVAKTHEGDSVMAKNAWFSAKGYGTLWNRVSEVAEARDIASLAREAKVSYSTVGSLWHKDAKGVHLDIIHKIAATLGVQLNELFPITDDEDHDGSL